MQHCTHSRDACDPRFLNSLLWRSLRSVAIVLRPEDTKSYLASHISYLSRWITSFDSFYKERTEISYSRNLHLLYHREISCIGNGFLRIAPDFAQLSKGAQDLGYTVSLTVDFPDVLEYLPILDGLVESNCVNILGLNIGNHQSLNSCRDDEVSLILRHFVDYNRSLGVIGEVDYLVREGILKHEYINAEDITLYPYLSSELLPLREHHKKPCYERFRVYVDVDGNVYPCLGLKGIESQAISHIGSRSPFEGLASSDCQAKLIQWIKAGPDPEVARPMKINPGLPEICRLHVAEVVSSEKDLRLR